MARVVIDSKFVADLYEVRGVRFQAILSDEYAPVVAIQQIEGFYDQVQLDALGNKQAAGQAHVGGGVIGAGKRIAAGSGKPVVGAVAVLIGIA
jgi:hypothetical protein